MTLEEALTLGVVQGLTEFLPISSSAHLKMVPTLLGWNDPGPAFTAVVQLGTLVAVLIYFAGDIIKILGGWFSSLAQGRFAANHEAKQAWMIAFSTIPIVAAGVLFKDNIESNLRSLYFTAVMLIVVAWVMALAEAYHYYLWRRDYAFKTLAEVKWWDGIIIGLAQAVALIPGTSRSGATISAGLFTGLDRSTAARFSFLLSLPAIFAAGVYQLYSTWGEIRSNSDKTTMLVTATIVAGIVGYASIAFLIGYLRTHSTGVFIAYRIIVGVVLLILLSFGVIKP